MTTTMVREAWTDERLDDLTKHVDEGFREVRAELRQQREKSETEFSAIRRQMTDESQSLRSEFAEVRAALGEQRAEAKGQIAKIDARLDGLTRTMQIGFWLIVSFLIGLMGMFAAQL